MKSCPREKIEVMGNEDPALSFKFCESKGGGRIEY